MIKMKIQERIKMIYRVVECEDKLDQEITNKNITDENLFKYMGNID